MKVKLTAESAKKDLAKFANQKKAKLLARFFKTGKGEYGEGDKFIGVVVPDTRKVAKKYKNLSFSEIQKLFDSPIHEERLLALIILIFQYEKGNENECEEIFNFYIKNLKNVNNWDLVDLPCCKIVGRHLDKRDRSILYKLVKSKNLWERRIAIISTFYFMKSDDFKDTLKIAQILIPDKEDLIQKAVGWMLREVGKRDLKLEKVFLDKNIDKIGRTALRYAIEKFPEGERKRYLDYDKLRKGQF